MFSLSLPTKLTAASRVSLRRLIWLALLLLSLYIGFQASAALAPQGATAAIQKLATPVSLADFHLQDQHGQPFGLARLQGHWSILFFGYTQCPDICPATLQQLTLLDEAMAQHNIAGVTAQTVFISVDPNRDTVQLAEYVGYFSRQFIGLSGDMTELGKLEQGMGAWHQYQPLASGGYKVAHSGELFLINPAGELQARLHPPLEINTLVPQLILMMSGQD